MKKKMAAILAGAMMTLAAGNAFAAFADLHLIRVAYQTVGGTAEVATDLGDIKSLLAAPSTTIAANPFMLSDFSAGTTLANINVGYFAADMYGTSGYVAGNANTAFAPTGIALTSMNSASGNIYAYYGAANTKFIGDQNYVSSYYNKMDQAGANKGSYAGTVRSNIAYGETNLANLATAGYVDMGLYNLPNSGRTIVTGKQVATIRLMADGSTVVSTSATPTPVPAAAWLMGSGLLGMVGIRRRSRKG